MEKETIKMVENNKKEESLEELKFALEQITNERDQYKNAYETAMEQNANIWGMYSNLVDYVATQTQRKNKANN